jgi:hypothetical protein
MSGLFMYAILSTRAKTKGKKKLARQALSHTPHNPNHLTHSANELELNTQPCHGLSAGLSAGL